MHARHWRARPSGDLAERLNAAADKRFPQAGHDFRAIISRVTDECDLDRDGAVRLRLNPDHATHTSIVSEVGRWKLDRLLSLL